MVSTRAGFTLVEVIVSLVLFSVGLLGLAGVAALAAGSMGRAFAEETAARHASALLDSLAFATGGGSGTAVQGGVTYEWRAGLRPGDEIVVTATLPHARSAFVLELRSRRIDLPPLAWP